MHPHEQLIRKFYTAFQNRDFKTMQSLYHPEATFTDPVFVALTSAEVKGMWAMLITSGKDLKIIFSNVHANDTAGGARWDAWYTFSRTGRQVHNSIHSSFIFKDNLIYKHTDTFNFWRWSRQALGLSGLLLGWTSLVKNKVRATARVALEKFMGSSR